MNRRWRPDLFIRRQNYLYVEMVQQPGSLCRQQAPPQNDDPTFGIDDTRSAHPIRADSLTTLKGMVCTIDRVVVDIQQDPLSRDTRLSCAGEIPTQSNPDLGAVFVS